MRMNWISMVFAALFVGAASFGQTPAPSGVVVLDTAGFWRMHHTLRPPVVQGDNGLTPILFNVKTNSVCASKWQDWETPAPPPRTG